MKDHSSILLTSTVVVVAETGPVVYSNLSLVFKQQWGSLLNKPMP